LNCFRLRRSIPAVVKEEERLVLTAPRCWTAFAESWQVEWTTDTETIIKLPIERLVEVENTIAIYVCVQRVVDVEQVRFAVKVVAASLDGEVDDTA
jgi:hypothetical protein